MKTVRRSLVLAMSGALAAGMAGPSRAHAQAPRAFRYSVNSPGYSFSYGHLPGLGNSYYVRSSGGGITTTFSSGPFVFVPPVVVVPYGARTTRYAPRPRPRPRYRRPTRPPARPFYVRMPPPMRLPR